MPWSGPSRLLRAPIHAVQSVQSLSRVRLFATPWTAARQGSLSITNSRSLRKPISTESVMPSNHLILCHPLLLPPSIFPSIRVFSNESVLLIRWSKYWSFSFSISSCNEYSGLISHAVQPLLEASLGKPAVPISSPTAARLRSLHRPDPRSPLAGPRRPGGSRPTSPRPRGPGSLLPSQAPRRT